MTDDFEVVGRFTPGDPADPDGDRATLRALEEGGGDLSKPTEFIHYLYFPDRERALEAARLIHEELGYTARGRSPEDPSEQWLVLAEREQVPTLENVERMRQALTTAAERFGGEYDGWEAAVTE
jgi:hypothetical protein